MDMKDMVPDIILIMNDEYEYMLARQRLTNNEYFADGKLNGKPYEIFYNMEELRERFGRLYDSGKIIHIIAERDENYN